MSPDDATGYGNRPYGEGPFGEGTDSPSDGATDPDPTMSTIIITSATDEGPTSYEFTISGETLAKNSSLASIQGNDIITGQTASGKVWGGADAYDFDGRITDFAWDGPEAPVVSIDGETVDPDRLGVRPKTTIDIDIEGDVHSVVVFGAATDGVSTREGMADAPDVILGVPRAEDFAE